MAFSKISKTSVDITISSRVTDATIGGNIKISNGLESLQYLTDAGSPLTPGSDDSVETHYKDTLDAEDEVSGLKIRHGMPGAICSFLAEVLGRVFRFLERDEREKQTRAPGRRRSLHWIKIATHTCTHWRDAAMLCASLWASNVLIRTYKSEWTREIIKRARGLPLAVEVHLKQCQPGIGNEALKIVNDILRHTRVLVVVDETSIKLPSDLDDGSISEFGEMLKTMINAPLLEECHVIGHSRSMLQQLPIDFLQNAPKLCALRFESCVLDCSSPMLNECLKTLKLSYSTIGPVTGYLLSALDRALDKQQFLVDSDIRSGSLEHRIELPQLENLTIDADVSQAEESLHHLDFPKTTTLILKLWSVKVLGKVVSPPMPANLGEMLGERMDPVSILQIQNLNRHFVNILAWDDFNGVSNLVEPNLSLPEEPARLDVQIEIPKLYDDEEQGDILVGWCNFLPIQQSLKVLVAGGLRLTTSQWINYFGGLESLEGIHAYGTGDSFLEALSTSETFESLKDLTITNRKPLYGETLENGDVDIEQVGAALTARRDHGLGLRRLAMNGWPEEEMMRDGRVLTEVADDFDWIHHEDEDFDEGSSEMSL